MYIKSTHCISPQHSTNDELFSGNVVQFERHLYEAIEPSYQEIIPRNLLRRMGKAVRLGIGAALPLLKDQDVDGIVIGTGNGGLEDCIKFLNQIMKYEEGTLTPTNFVQSTPNSLAGLIALMTKTTGYNATHVHRGAAFESALLDAKLLVEEGAEKLLVGGFEELSDYNANIESLGGLFKEVPVSSNELLQSNTPGTVYGEGAAMFMIGRYQENAIAEVVDVTQISTEKTEDVMLALDAFLDKNAIIGVDEVYLGRNGDSVTNHFYNAVAKRLNTNESNFKHLCGDYPASSSFAMWLAAKHFSGKTLTLHKNRPQSILIYNHFRGQQHGFILLKPTQA